MAGGDVDGSQPAPGGAALVQDVTKSLRARSMARVVVVKDGAEVMRYVNAVLSACRSFPSLIAPLLSDPP